MNTILAWFKKSFALYTVYLICNQILWFLPKFEFERFFEPPYYGTYSLNGLQIAISKYFFLNKWLWLMADIWHIHIVVHKLMNDNQTSEYKNHIQSDTKAILVIPVATNVSNLLIIVLWNELRLKAEDVSWIIQAVMFYCILLL